VITILSLKGLLRHLKMRMMTRLSWWSKRISTRLEKTVVAVAHLEIITTTCPFSRSNRWGDREEEANYTMQEGMQLVDHQIKYNRRDVSLITAGWCPWLPRVVQRFRRSLSLEVEYHNLNNRWAAVEAWVISRLKSSSRQWRGNQLFQSIIQGQVSKPSSKSNGIIKV